jgi:hypothetical protein
LGFYMSVSKTNCRSEVVSPLGQGNPAPTLAGRHRPFFVTVIAVLLGVGAVVIIAGGIVLSLRPEESALRLQTWILLLRCALRS